MGAWGTGPLDNDNAADWFGDLFEDTGFRDGVMAGIASGDPDFVRAGAWVVARLATVYVWPIEELDQDRLDAAAGLITLQADEDWLEIWGDPEEVQAELASEIEALELTPDELAQAHAQAGVDAAGTRKAVKARPLKTTKKARKVVAKKKATKKKAAKKKAAKKKTAKKKTAKKKTAGGGWLVSLHYQDGKSDKFWRIRLDGVSHTVNYGRAGTDGQTKTKSFDTAAAAKAAAEKLIAQKRNKGYA